MLQESLVILACITGKGCTETYGRYYNQNPDVQEIVKTNEKKVELFLGPTMLTVLAPMAIAASGGTGHIKLYRELVLQANRKSATIVFIKDF